MRGGRIFIIIGIVLLIGVAIVGLIYLSGIFKPAPPPTPNPADVTPTEEPSNMIEIVVAAQNIPRGTRITEENNAVTVAKWPEESVPPGALTDAGAAYDRIARTDIVLGMPIIDGMLTDRAGSLAAIGSDAALRIPAGRVGYAIAVTGNSGVAWALRSGDHVDALISLMIVDIDEEFQTPLPSWKVMCLTGVTPEGLLNVECIPVPIGRSEFLPNGSVTIEGPRGDARPRMVTQMTVQDAIVLQVGTWPEETAMALKHPEPTAVPVEGEEAPPPPTPIPPTPLTQWVTLAVTPQDALVLKYAEETGASIDFVLRSAGETATFTTQAVTLNYIFEKYAIEVPAKLPYGITPPTFAIRQGATGEASADDEGTEHSRDLPQEEEMMRYLPICTDECWKFQ
jgi:Flp pilus assembly protein CpaB